MSEYIYQKTVQNQFFKLTDTEKDQYIKTHWIHNDKISKKHFLGRLLNKWIFTRIVFRKLCGISLSATIQGLEKSRKNVSEEAKRLEFNETCDFLIALIQRMHTKNKTTYQQNLTKLKFTLISLTPEQAAKVAEKVGKMKAGDDIQGMRKTVDEILKEHSPALKETLITEIFKHVDPVVAPQLFQENLVANSAAEKAAKVAGIAQNSEALKQVLADKTLHDQVAQGIAQIKQSNASEAASIIQQVKQALPSGVSPQNSLGSLLKPDSGLPSQSMDNVDVIIKNVKEIKASDTYAEIERKVGEIQGKYPANKKEEVLSEILKHADPEIAVPIFNLSRIGGNAAKVLGLIENQAALKKICQGKNNHDSLADGLEKIRIVNAKKGDFAAEALAKGFSSLEGLSTRLKTDLYSRSDEGVSFANTWQNASKNLALKINALSNEMELINFMKELKTVPPEDHYSFIQTVVKNVHPDLLPDLFSQNFTADGDAEMMAKLIVASEFYSLDFIEKLGDKDHLRIADALNKLAVSNSYLAEKLVSKMNEDPTKLPQSIQAICQELMPITDEPFARLVKQLNQGDSASILQALNDEIKKTKSGAENKRNLIAQALSVVAPKHAVFLYLNLPLAPGPLLGWGLYGLQRNPAALDAILADSKTHQNVYTELWGVNGFRSPLNQTIVDDFFLRMEKLSLLKDFISLQNLNLSPLVKDLPITTQKILLDHLKDDARLPDFAAAIAHSHSVPKWEHDETWRVQGPYGIKDFYYRPVTKDQLSMALFDDPKTQQALKTLTKPEDAIKCIIEFADLLNERFNPLFTNSISIDGSQNEYAKGTDWHNNKQKLLDQLMEKKQFLSEEYSSVIKEDYAEGLESVANHLLDFVKRLPGNMQNKQADIIQAIKKHKGIKANIYLLLLVLKLDPKEQDLMACACHDHEFAYLMFQLDAGHRNKLLKDRLELLKGKVYRIKEFQEVYMAFIPVTSVAERKQTGALFETYISQTG